MNVWHYPSNTHVCVTTFTLAVIDGDLNDAGIVSYAVSIGPDMTHSYDSHISVNRMLIRTLEWAKCIAKYLLRPVCLDFRM